MASLLWLSRSAEKCRNHASEGRSLLRVYLRAAMLLLSFPTGVPLSGLLAGSGAPVRRAVLACGVASFGLLSGCDQLGIETPQKAAEHQQAEAKAIGSACRHAMRAIEDCYTLNPKADKAAVFIGWREMDEYMRENKLEGVAPVVPRPPAPGASKASAPAGDDEEDAPDKGDSESGSKPAKQGKAKSH